MIYIYNGPIQSGKTTRLANWLEKYPVTDGILAPIRDGKRYLQRIANNETRCLQPPHSRADTLTVGRFQFSASVFEWGREQLLKIGPSPSWLIIDEIGKLELRMAGLEPAVSTLLTQGTGQNIILVVRESLVQTVIDHYRLSETGYRFLNSKKIYSLRTK